MVFVANARERLAARKMGNAFSFRVVFLIVMASHVVPTAVAVSVVGVLRGSHALH